MSRTIILEEERVKCVPGWASRAVLSAVPVMVSLVLSRVDLEESGVWMLLVVWFE